MKIEKKFETIEKAVITKVEVPTYVVELSQDDLDYIVLVLGKVAGNASDIYSNMSHLASNLDFERSPSRSSTRGVWKYTPATNERGIWVERLPESEKTK